MDKHRAIKEEYISTQLTSNKPGQHEAADERFGDLAKYGQSGPLTFRVFHLTDRLHQPWHVLPDRESAANQQVNRNETLDWTVIQVYCSYNARFETSVSVTIRKTRRSPLGAAT